MAARDEITRRLKKQAYESLSRSLFDKNFDSLSTNEYKDILKIADMYGSKYKQFYIATENMDIRTITSNLERLEYNPIFTFHQDLRVVGIDKSDDSFTIFTQFFTQNEEWELVEENGQKYKKPKLVQFRRALVIEKQPQNNYLILSIDPIGEGAAVSREIPAKFDELRDNIQLDLRQFFDIKQIDEVLHRLINEQVLIPTKISVKDRQTNRLKSVTAQVNRDNIKDEEVFESWSEQTCSLENLKMKFGKETVEIFGTTLLKISTKANKKVTDELTNNIISVLQTQ